MNELYYKKIVSELPDSQLICTFGKTRIYVLDDCLLVASNENKHVTVLDYNKKLIERIMELKKTGCFIPYIGGDRNEGFCVVDQSHHRLYKLSWMAYAAYKDGAFDKNIKNLRNGRLYFRKEKESWDCRKLNLIFSKNKNKKLRVNRLYKRDIISVGGVVAEDEEFIPIPGESAVWISNYGRVISKRKGKPRLLKPTLNKSKNPEANKYWRLYLPQTMRGEPIKNSYYIHSLVAGLFLEKPAWIVPEDPLDVHHIKKIKGQEDDPLINCYKNLMFIPRKIHAAVDSIHEIAVMDKRKWVIMDFQQASSFYGISPYDFMNAIGNEKYQKPTKTRGQYQYYKKNIKIDNNKIVEINVRIVRERDIKKE